MEPIQSSSQDQTIDISLLEQQHADEEARLRVEIEQLKRTYIERFGVPEPPLEAV